MTDISEIHRAILTAGHAIVGVSETGMVWWPDGYQPNGAEIADVEAIFDSLKLGNYSITANLPYTRVGVPVVVTIQSVGTSADILINGSTYTVQLDDGAGTQEIVCDAATVLNITGATGQLAKCSLTIPVL